MLIFNFYRTGYFPDQGEIQSEQESIFICSQDVVGKNLLLRRLSYDVGESLIPLLNFYFRICPKQVKGSVRKD